MSPENLEQPLGGSALADAARGASDAINRDDLDAMLEWLDPDVEFTSLIAEAEGETFRGHDGAKKWWRAVRGAFAESHWEFLQAQPIGAGGICEIRITGTIGGAAVAQLMWQAVELRDGRARWWAFFRSEAEAREALAERAGEEPTPSAEERFVLRLYAAWNRRDLATTGAMLDPEIEWRLAGRTRFPGMEPVYRGLEELGEFWTAFLEPWPDVEIDVEGMCTGDDGVVVAFVRFRVTGTASGIDLDAPYVHVLTVRDEKLVAVHAFDDPAAALAAAGLDR